MFAYLQIVGAFGSNPAAVPPAQTFDGGFAPSPAQSMPSAGPFSSSSTVFGMMLVCRPNHTIVAHKRAGKDTLFEYIVAQLSWRMASLWKCQVQYGLMVCTIHGTSLPVVPHVCINELHCILAALCPACAMLLEFIPRCKGLLLLIRKFAADKACHPSIICHWAAASQHFGFSRPQAGA